ncbi:MAG: KAP family NTPase [Candidatus Gastranaerophilales bacterium]|nr:KAP family NTPase [Candidatus Gastranaerophilales bacterium]
MEERMDLLDRDSFINNVVKLVNQLADNKRGCCFAIEGDWGIGKSFVMEEIEATLAQEQSEKSGNNRYFLFHYNCWQYDYYEEPAIAIISAMISSIKKEEAVLGTDIDDFVKSGYEIAWEKFKEIADLCIKNKIGIGLISLVEDIKNTQQKNTNEEYGFNTLFSFSQTIEGVRKKLQEMATEKTIVLFVDELDRCIPHYAIKVLERLHHIFYGLKNVIVVMAIDRKQLAHSVEEMFGIDSYMDVEKYLRKFIDFSMRLECGTLNDYFFQKYSYYFGRAFPIDNQQQEELRKLFSELFKGVDIRRQEKIIEKANVVNSTICNEMVDISVLVFEILYEILKLWKFGDMSCFVQINDVYDISVEKNIGKKRYKMLNVLESNHIKPAPPDSPRQKQICDSIWGRILWYFANIFNKETLPYVSPSEKDDWLEDQVKIVKSYCKFCEQIE